MGLNLLKDVVTLFAGTLDGKPTLSDKGDSFKAVLGRSRYRFVFSRVLASEFFFEFLDLFETLLYNLKIPLHIWGLTTFIFQEI